MRTAHAKEIQRQEKVDLAESLGVALADKEIRVVDLQKRLEHNYYHMVHLGSRLYEAQDLTARTCSAWERSDRR